jgi:nucleotide-binding universal stress UspA family protein
MFKTILWATDGSETAARALPFALEFAETAEARLIIAHAREIFVGRMGGYPVFVDEGELREKIHRQVDELKQTGLQTTYVVRSCQAGHAPKLIAEIAREYDADLIVVGTHGHGRLGGMLLGSVTQGLLHEQVAPVLAIPTAGEAPASASETRTGAVA